MITKKKVFALLASTFAIGLMFVCSNVDDSDGTYGLNVSHLKPLAPTNVRATATSSSSITITWSAASGADGYRIYRSLSANGNYTQVGTSETSPYTDTNLSANTTYYYKISAYNSRGESERSNEASATTLQVVTYYCPEECSEQTGENKPLNCFETEEACLASITPPCARGIDCDDDIGRCTPTNGTCTNNIERGNCSGTFVYNAMCPIFGQFTDSRDSKTYRFVTIGTQIWMAENLNFEIANGEGSWCYDNNPANCEIYGRLYDWATAMNIDKSYNTTLWGGSDVNHRGICPVGWHLPSNAEWTTLVNFVGSNAGIKLSSSTGWETFSDTLPVGGTNEFGFSALPGGGHWSITTNSAPLFLGIDHGGYWWSTMEIDALYTSYKIIRYANSFSNSISVKVDLYSVRCVRD